LDKVEQPACWEADIPYGVGAQMQTTAFQIPCFARSGRDWTSFRPGHFQRWYGPQHTQACRTGHRNLCESVVKTVRCVFWCINKINLFVCSSACILLSIGLRVRKKLGLKSSGCSICYNNNTTTNMIIIPLAGVKENTHLPRQGVLFFTSASVRLILIMMIMVMIMVNSQK
jgi:hypothetical protein